MRLVLIVFDGLRPELVRPSLMPSLCALQSRGVAFAAHRAVFPTETRVNSASIATGTYPGTHGIVANTFVDRSLGLQVNTGDHTSLDQLAASAGRFVVPLTLAERVRASGMSCAVVGSGSPGSTLMQDPAGQELLVNVRGLIRPPAREAAMVRSYGSVQPPSAPATAWNDQACAIFAREVVAGGFDVGIAWLCDPDFTQHKHGLGAVASLTAVRQQDDRLSRLLGVLPDDANVVVASDHGFSTIVEPIGRDQLPSALGLPAERSRLVGSGIYLEDADRDLEMLVAKLNGLSWMGPVFVRGRDASQRGAVDGAFSLRSVGIDHAVRSPDIVFSRRWSAEPNEYGVDGLVFGGSGLATHGSMSPFDRACVLIAAGPAFKAGVRSQVPSGAVDIAPTLLHLLGVDGSQMEGRVLAEALLEGPDPGDVAVEREHYRIVTSPGSAQTMIMARVREASYLDGFAGQPR